MPLIYLHQPIDNTKPPPKSLITHRLRTALEWSVGVTIAIVILLLLILIIKKCHYDHCGHNGILFILKTKVAE